LLTLQQTIDRAEEILSKTLNKEVSIEHHELLNRENKRNRIIRVFVKEDNQGIPCSFIVKQTTKEGYDPNDRYAQATVMHFNDWAGTEFLSSLFAEDTMSLSPRYYGGDTGMGFIMEDLGTQKSSILFNGEEIPIDANLLPVLFHGSAQQAEESLLAWMKCLGNLHVATIGKEAEYEKIRNRLGNRKQSSRQVRADWLRDFIPRIEDAFTTIEFKPEKHFYDELKSLCDTIENPGPFLAYTHGDTCPDNCSYVNGKVRLIDFEMSSYQHALLDAVYPRIGFPTCGWSNALPCSTIEKLENAYREQLVKGCPEAAEDNIFKRGLIDACSIWGMIILNTLTDSVEEDRPWGVSTSRNRILTRLEILARIDNEFNHLPSIIGTASRLASTLCDIWPDSDTLPIYPAFNTQ
jgi:hypothetical protein